MADCDSDMEYMSDNDYEFEDYYNSGLEDCDIDQIDPKHTDPEYFVYECLNVEEVEKLLNESVEKLSNQLQITPSLAKVLLHENKWNTTDVVEKYRNNASSLLISARIKAAPAAIASTSSAPISSVASSAACGASAVAVVPCTSSVRGQPITAPSQLYRTHICPVCVTVQAVEKFHHLSCQHSFCRDCWAMHFEIQIDQGITTQIGCMEQRCEVRVPEDLVLNLLNKPMVRERYQQFAFADYVKSHPELRFCPGLNCKIIIRSTDISPKKATCKSCKSAFCFKCGSIYHAPTDCQIIRKWLTKCADDSETANYISAHTKDCPKCHICIEKNGGCNHMQCFSCKYEFCWMCLGNWKAHGSEYYECSRYKENPNIAHESVHVQAREALKKYLHYYERWENHSKSLELEQQTLDRMKARINDKVMNGLGTWIDWQYLFDAAALLAKCRYTLQYTYPYAYYMEASSRKDLFEYQQAQLEAEIENLSWKIERAETTHRAALENQMDVAEKRRTTLLKDFFTTEA
ncbi:potential E3 ubiquitin-protein ligase ariadne-2 [Toxorhynchites rutilus septentrionalis]|uniref:potential E3 ubiquitin-protein ligase ariadne-2 n=1 Tax=Toxorhynchites rutilus septentrionalis TaxID=329112 RepID=UPI0024789CFF|nr:potential E3 ubiquitin-protein ligase ariadne-2 [Toxorhynchites rutilus septentrionalis]